MTGMEGTYLGLRLLAIRRRSFELGKIPSSSNYC